MIDLMITPGVPCIDPDERSIGDDDVISVVYVGEVQQPLEDCERDSRYSLINFSNRHSLTEYDLEYESGLFEKLIYRDRVLITTSSTMFKRQTENTKSSNPKIQKELKDLYVYQRPTIPFDLECENAKITRQQAYDIIS